MCRYLVVGAAATLILIVSPRAGQSNPDQETAVEPTPVAVQRVVVAPADFRDEAAMVLVGAGLLILAAAVRRSA
jgi:uncharacterized membrane protein